MRKLIVTLSVLAAAAAQAEEIGPLRTTGEAGDWSLGLHYYLDQSTWRTGSDLGDALIGDLRRQGPFATAAFAAHDNWEITGSVGGSEYETDPDFPGEELSSSLDSFYSLGVRGTLVERGRTLFGPFVQYTAYSDYELDGNISANGPAQVLRAETQDWRALSAGLAAQHRLDNLSVYYGVYHTDNKVDVDGTYGGNPFDVTAKEDEHKGFFLGAVKPVTDELSLSVEYDHVSDWGVSVGLNYNFQHPDPVVVTETRTEVRYIERPKPKGPADFNRTVRFELGSTAVDEDYWDEIRDFAGFLQQFEGSEGFIEGHCDCLGSDEANMTLSERRAESVKNILVRLFGIDEDRLYVVPMGESSPAVEPDPVRGRPENRRVELIGRAYGE